MTELLQTQPGIRINHLMKNFTDERVDKNLIKDTQQQQDRAKDRIWAGGCCYMKLAAMEQNSDSPD